MARALGGYAERVEKPEEIAPAIKRARRATEERRRYWNSSPVRKLPIPTSVPFRD